MIAILNVNLVIFKKNQIKKCSAKSRNPNYRIIIFLFLETDILIFSNVIEIFFLKNYFIANVALNRKYYLIDLL